MEIRHLKLIKTIVEEGSMTKAVDKLCLTQSALSHQLREIEQQIRAKMFDRTNRKLVPTEVGRRVYDTAVKVLHELDKTKNEIDNLVQQEGRKISLSAECYTSYRWLPSIITEFSHVNPEVEVKIDFEATHFPVQRLLERSLDIGFTTNPIPQQEVHYEEIFQDEMLAVVSEHHHWANRPFITAEDFAYEKLIIHSKPMETVSVWQFLLKPEEVEPKEVIVLPLTAASIALVKNNQGIMVMADWAIKPYLNWAPNLKAVKITKKGLKRTHYAAVTKDKGNTSAIQQFVDFTKRDLPNALARAQFATFQ